MNSNKDEIRIFTDGAARGNPGPGGWGAVVADGSKVVELGGREAHTTNNRMELEGAIGAFEYLSKESPKNCEIVVYTDSGYVLNGITKWVRGWKKQNWMTAQKKPVLNQDLWEKLSSLRDELELNGNTIEWKLLPGHSGIPANERCDVIATEYADKKSEKLFHGSKSEYPIDLDTLMPDHSLLVSKKQRKSNAPAYSYVSSVDGKIETHKNWSDCEKRVKGARGARFKKAFSVEEEKKIIEEFS